VTDIDITALVDDPRSRTRYAARDIAEAFLERIEQRTPATHAVLTACPDAAMDDAARVDAARSTGRPLPLDGMPIVLKDNIDVAGVRGTCGAKFFADRIATKDATVVRLLRQAGAIILGKAQTTEFMFALAAHPMYEPCRNVWDYERIPGASSSGTGCAVADDEAIGGLGTDTGGSVRIPAAFGGVTGLRPTFGVISTHGVFPLSRSLDVVGPIARSAADVARLYEVLAQYDPLDNRSVRYVPVDDEVLDVARLRIGLPRQFFFDDCEAQIESTVRAAIDLFRQRGATIVELDLPLAYAAHDGFTLLIRAEALAVHADRLSRQPEDFSVDVRERLRLGEQLTGRDVALLIEDMHAWKRQLVNAFDQVDVIMTPTAQCLPPLLTEAKLGKLPNVTRLTYPWSFGHVPAISVPCGFTDNQLPVGLQVVAQPHRDRLLLDLAQHYQAYTEWHRARPIH
jgi:aspartyl-tRNA(Asn)/glutamyl-tRNA(Gln) amidotransferase subunit A